MLEKIKILTKLINHELEAIANDDFSVTIPTHVAHCAAYLEEFNALEPKERFDLLTDTDAKGKAHWSAYAVSMVIYAIGHSYLVSSPQPISGQTIDHMAIDGEPATIITTPDGERMSFDNFPEFGEAHFTNFFPLHEQAALATKHIAMMCRGLGRIW